MKQIISDLRKEEVLQYLGYRDTQIPKHTQRLLDFCMEETVKVLTPRYIYQKFSLKEEKEGISVAGTSLLLEGADIKKHLCGCKEAYLLCVTAGIKMDQMIRGKMLTVPEEGVVFDSCGSTAVEQIADYAQGEIEELEGKRGNALTSRFSPGYGDFPLSIQPDIIKVMEAHKRMGLTTSSDFLLVPMKSVTAFLGVLPIWKKEEKEKKTTPVEQCYSCSLRDSCIFRRKKRDREGGCKTNEI